MLFNSLMEMPDAVAGGTQRVTLDYFAGQSRATNGPMTSTYVERFDPHKHIYNYTGKSTFLDHNHAGEL